MTPALAILAAAFVGAIALGLLARRGREMSLEQWTVGGRRFGTALMVLLMAGEIYTTFTFLGGSGWAYGKGAPAYYILAYGAIGFAIAYFLLPPIWRYARDHALVSQSDYFEHRYASRPLGVLVALVGVVAMIPYLVLQLKGLGILVHEASEGAVDGTSAVLIGTAGLVAYVVVSGIRGSAWTAVAKDAAILVAAVALGVWLPQRYYGGIGPMFRAIDAARPGFTTLPPTGLSPSWFASTVLFTAAGFYMWPHTFASVFSSRSEDALRRSAIVMPLYQLVLLFVFFVGFAAVLQVPGLAGADADLALMRLVRRSAGPAVVGAVGAAGLLTALVPGSMILLAASTVLARNVVGPVWPGLGDAGTARLARSGVPVVAAVAVVATLRGGSAIVPLLLMGYSLVTQLFPAVVLSLLPRNPVRAPAVMAGILVGEAVVAWTTVRGVTLAQLLPSAPAGVRDLNVGAAALAVNVLVTAAVAFATRRRRSAARVPASPAAGR